MSDLILATAGYDHQIRFWDLPSGLVKFNIVFNDSQINNLVISADRKYLGVAAHNIVKIYDISGNPS